MDITPADEASAEQSELLDTRRCRRHHKQRAATSRRSYRDLSWGEPRTLKFSELTASFLKLALQFCDP
jgi:hypothetical protein